MKKVIFLLVAIAMTLATPMHAGNPEAGKLINITDSSSKDQYLAGETVKINAPIRGDVVAAAGTIRINDTIEGDLLLAGGNIHINNIVLDDIRVAGGTVNITNIVLGDVVAFGGTVNIKKGAVIYGDVLTAGGTVSIDGIIKGNVKASGGTVNIDGVIEGMAELNAGDLYINNVINGDVTISATTLLTGENAKFNSNVRYWTEAGEFTDLGSAIAGTVVYDKTLKPDNFFASDLQYMGLGYAGFLMYATLASLVLAFLLIFVFNKYFERSSKFYKADFFLSFGYGILYIIAIPFLIILMMITVIGIPLGIVFLMLYIFTLIFGQTFASVVIAYWSRTNFHKHWNKWMVLLISGGIFIVLNLILLIPIAGWLASILIVGAAFGAIILSIRKRSVPALK